MRGLISRKFVMLRQVVADRFPLCLGADKDVGGRANSWRIEERPESDVDVLAIADYGVQERAALAAANVMIDRVAETKQIKPSGGVQGSNVRAVAE